MVSLRGNSIFALFPVMALSGSVLSGGEISAGQCGPPRPVHGIEVDAGQGFPLPRVVAEAVWVPVLDVNFRDRRSGQPLAQATVSVCYDWRWFRYPYPETLLGAWQLSFECRQCRLDGAGRLSIPAHAVTPRGWYDGWLRFGREPRFEGIRLELDGGGYTRSFPYLTARHLRELAREGSSPIVLSAADALAAARLGEIRRNTP